MSTSAIPTHRRILGILVGAISGAGFALLVGLLWIALSPDNGFGDLAAAAMTKVVLIPAGALVGGAVGFRFAR